LQETVLLPGLVFSSPNAGEMNTSPNSITAPIIFIFASGIVPIVIARPFPLISDNETLPRTMDS